jgi:drug/metabolite transporter (DMT)-like permease
MKVSDHSATQESNRLPLLAGLLSVLLWGASFVGTKIALAELQPITLIILRLALGIVVLAPVVARSEGLALPARNRLPAIILLGFLGIGIHQWFQAVGMQTITASDASWITALAPAMMAIMAWGILKEKASWLQIFGIVLAMMGAILISSIANNPLAGGSARIGQLMVFIAAAAWAAYSIAGKVLLRSWSPLKLTFFAMAAGWIFLLPIFVFQRGWEDLAALSSETYTAVLFLGVGSTGAAFALYSYALQRTSAALIAAVQYFEPLITVVIAAVLLHEKMAPLGWVGGFLILGGVWLVERKTKTG